MKTIYVRVRLKSGLESFHRCAIKFSRKWCKVEADAATAKRLEAEQMLEVSETKPVGYEEETLNAADTAGASTTDGSDTSAAAPGSTGETAAKLDEALGGKTAPEDQAERLAAIKAAIAQLDTSDTALFTASNKPKTEAIAAITGWPVTAAEREAVLATMVEGGAQ